MANDGKIIISMDGPYEVPGDVPLNQARIVCDAGGDAVAWDVGKTYDTGDCATYKLCRCGQSRDKPFCDGSHEDCEFCGSEKADRPDYAEHAELLRGEGVDLRDDESLCAGAGFCHARGSIWAMLGETGDPEIRRRAVEEACNCPAGRLTAVGKDGVEIEPALPREISLVEDPANGCRGPLWVKGGIEIEGANGEKYQTRNRVALCRCGASTNMPYCDGSHYACDHMQGLDC